MVAIVCATVATSRISDTSHTHLRNLLNQQTCTAAVNMRHSMHMSSGQDTWLYHRCDIYDCTVINVSMTTVCSLCVIQTSWQAVLVVHQVVSVTHVYMYSTTDTVLPSMVTLNFCGKELHKRCISKTQTQGNSHTLYTNIGPNPMYFKTYQALPSVHFFQSLAQQTLHSFVLWGLRCSI